MLRCCIAILVFFLRPFIVKLLLSASDICRLFLNEKDLQLFVTDFVTPPMCSERHPFLVLEILNYDAVAVPVYNTSFIFLVAFPHNTGENAFCAVRHRRSLVKLKDLGFIDDTAYELFRQLSDCSRKVSCEVVLETA